MSNRTLDKINPRYHAQIAAQLGVKSAVSPAKPKPTIRQNRNGMNKTEARFYEYLKEAEPYICIHREVSLPLANGVRYKVDFLIARPGEKVPNEYARSFVQAYEIKGFHRDDAIVKLKVAAKEYPWIRFYLVHATNGGDWQFEEVFP